MPVTRSVARRTKDIAAGISADDNQQTIPAEIPANVTVPGTSTEIIETAPSNPAPIRRSVTETVSTKQNSKAQRKRQANLKVELMRAKYELLLAQQEAINASHSEDDSDDLDSNRSNSVSAQNIEEWLDGASKTLPAQALPRPTATEQNIPSTSTGACAQPDLAQLTNAITLAVKAARVPKFTELPEFNGSIQDWLPFRAAYYETENMFTPVENTIRMRRSLKGKAKEAVQGLLITNSNTEDIMKALETRFGRPESLAMAEIDSLRKLPRLSESPTDICIFSNKVTNATATLRTLNCLYFLYNPEVTKQMIEKLTPTLRYRYYDFAATQSKEEPDLVKFEKFIQREAELCGPFAEPEQMYAIQSTEQKRVQKVHSVTEATIPKCPVCSATDHKSALYCEKFKNADTDSRWEMAKKLRLCFRCLRYKNRTHRCRANTCDVDHCKYFHNKMLHFVRKDEPENSKLTTAANPEQIKTDVSKPSEIINSAWTAARKHSFLKIIPVTVSGPKGKTDTFALLDDGSTVSLIDSAVSDSIGAQGPVDSLRIEAINQLKTAHLESKRVNIVLKGLNEREEQIQARTLNNLQVSAQEVPKELVEQCEHLRDLSNVLCYENVMPKILIGQDNWHLLLSTEIRKGDRSQPVASLTPLGWVLHGIHTRTIGRKINFINHLSITPAENDIEELIKQYFTMDALCLSPRKPMSDPEQQALHILENNTTRTEEGRYQTALLWRKENVTLPNNYENTLKRLFGIEKKLDRDPELRQKYTEQMDALISKKYAELAPTKTEGMKKVWYLPHFAVINPMKPGKVRVVHDAAAKTERVSLNDMLMKGPELLQSLPGVIMRFRQHQIAITADIKEMFMQVKLRPEDRDSLRYLWRGDRRDDKPPDEYRMSSLIFGAACSPSAALFVKNLNAKQYEKTHPEAAAAIVKKHYMDDYLDSFKTLDNAIRIASDVRNIHKEACFELRQWKSNSAELLLGLGELGESTNELTNVEIYPEEKTERVLGITWKPNVDEFTFNLNLIKIPTALIEGKTPTKREALRIIMSLFDPLGFASPVTIRAKQILQEVWRRGTSWDDVLEDDIAQQWKSWIVHLKNLRNITIPRCYLGYSDASLLQLHVFTDASESAYSATLYWRTEALNGDINVSLILAKAKVSPLKLTSIPRLELQAAVMGARMAETVIEEHERYPDSKTFWTDSKTVLTWIKTGSKSYKPYVAHRLAAIEDSSKTNEWRWLPSKLNVADDATRDVPISFNKEHRWYRGPEFLYQHEEMWPSDISLNTDQTREEKVNHLVNDDKLRIAESIPDITRFSSWDRLRFATARVLQFISMCRSSKQTVCFKRTRQNPTADLDWRKKVSPCHNKKRLVKKTPSRNAIKFLSVTAELLKTTEKLLIVSSQEDSFAQEIKDLKNNKPIDRESRLHLLSIEYTDGAIRLRSRIDATTGITDTLKRPMVVDGNHRTVKLWINAVHRQLHHAGVEATINECRQQYWVLRLRPTTRSLLRQCLHCRMLTATAPYPRTGDHPESRLAHHQRPFTFVGIDYFGPVTLTVGRTIQKRYVAIFTCLTTRAIHLEISASLSSSSAIMALRRMIARRGCPSMIWSDNGSNLKGADRELRQAIDDATSEEAAKRTISWRYIPPGAPFMGGAWERMVRSVKTALTATLHERNPTEEVFSTLLAEVEYTVNNRPLTHVSVDAADPEALTPNHFLIGGHGRVPIPGTFDDTDTVSRTSWRAAQRLADIYWKRWLREYLPELQHRREPHGRGPSVEIGSLVLIVNPNLPRNVWVRGVVTAVYPGPDKIVRTVDVKTKGGVMRRPVRKLILIPTEVVFPAPE